MQGTLSFGYRAILSLTKYKNDFSFFIIVYGGKNA